MKQIDKLVDEIKQPSFKELKVCTANEFDWSQFDSKEVKEIKALGQKMRDDYRREKQGKFSRKDMKRFFPQEFS